MGRLAIAAIKGNEFRVLIASVAWAAVVAGCTTDHYQQFYGDSPASRYMQNKRQDICIVASGKASPAQRYVALRLSPDTNSLFLAFPASARTQTLRVDIDNPMVEAWWLGGWLINCEEFAQLSSTQRSAVARAYRLEGQIQVRWKATNDFRIHAALKAPQEERIEVKGD